MMQYLERFLRMSGLLFRFSQGFHPRIKMAALPPLPVGAEGDDEVIEVAVAGDLGEAEVLAALNRQRLDFRFVKAEFVRGETSFHKALQLVDFQFSWPSLSGSRVGARRDGLQSPQGEAPGTPVRREDIAALLAPGDVLLFSAAGLELRMDFAHQGQERFARIYRLLDPERKWTACLRRKAVIFKHED
jgi:hypothetical protein